MHTGGATVIGPNLQYVADVHHNGSSAGGHINPAVTAAARLQTATVILKQQGNGTRVRVVMQGHVPQGRD